VNKPIASKTPKQVYDVVRERETAIELLPEGELKERVRGDLARLRARAETLQAVHKAANRKSLRR
jgi:hypothetical protein